ncbi:DUF1156 domain-containing protein [Planctomicrobium sp. SH527]|uniref:DUF1156 domain-containing protein n=1 Tax=Planctomicrobium sp. SH527 TaxID=3448123 RepID=UPI003F5B0702
MAKIKKKTKAEELREAVAEAVGAGRELHLESVDFSDPNRPKTCLEVDFPILPINHVAAIEGNAGKPIYQMSKWWARRRSSVFRAMLIAAATKAPDDPAEAAKLVWDSYYGNHQKNEAFRKLKVADIFMGGGTTIVEGARLGMQMYGNDLNPVAWLVVKNELAQVDPKEVQKLLDTIEAEVKPQIMPFYACDCPRGHKGKWTHQPSGKVMGANFDPLLLTPEQRPEYEYEGPEVIYTFWAKHGPCQASECNHRTPIMSNPIISVKTMTVKAWAGKQCKACGEEFDIEKTDSRMAPTAKLVVVDTEPPYTVMDQAGNYTCPHCGNKHCDPKAANDGESVSLGKAKSKNVALTLFVNPRWLKGSRGTDSNGNRLGGSTNDNATFTCLWYEERSSSLELIEVRGSLPSHVTCPTTGETFSTSSEGGTVPKKSHFACGECGTVQDILATAKRYGTTPPISAYAVQGYCPLCDKANASYGGRFFSLPDISLITSATREWQVRSTTDLNDFWPRQEIPYGLEADFWSVRHHGYTHFWKMFNERQLHTHSLFARSIFRLVEERNSPEIELVAGAFQQYLRNQCMFTLWNPQRDTLEPHFSKNNYRPKSLPVENCVFHDLGRGNWLSCSQNIFKSIEWREAPWELASNEDLQGRVSSHSLKGKSTKVLTGDSPEDATLTCNSSSSLSNHEDESLDLIITDPPFGDLVQYSEMADYFYVWIKIVLGHRYSDLLDSDSTPKALEVVSNRARHSEEADQFYQRLLTQCWRESFRVLKRGGVLAFTFHHSEDEPWVAVLTSLFDAGFYLESTYPIRSDETKGKGEFGAQKIEFDIIHVCRKRLQEPETISWARLRRQIMKDVRQLQEIIEQHQKEGLGEADLQVIRRGKALEYYSRHYGKVYIEKGREDEFTVKDALVGINQLLDDESDTTSEAPPVLAEPYTRQFLRLFADRNSLERDQMQKHLRGTGVSPSEFLERGWCNEVKKIFTIKHPLEWAQQWKGKSRKGMSRDFDQTWFLIGACYDDSGIKASDTLNSGSFAPHPAIGDLLDWFTKHGSDPDMKSAAKRAKSIYSDWKKRNEKVVVKERLLFDLEDE